MLVRRLGKASTVATPKLSRCFGEAIGTSDFAACLSEPDLNWLLMRRYGKPDAPFLGVFLHENHSNPTAEHLVARRRDYCKVLLYVAGSSRPARDWITGWACCCPARGGQFVSLLLSGVATEQDVRDWASRCVAHPDFTPVQKDMVARCICIDAASVVAQIDAPDEFHAAEDRLQTVGRYAGLSLDTVREYVVMSTEERKLLREKKESIGFE